MAKSTTSGIITQNLGVDTHTLIVPIEVWDKLQALSFAAKANEIHAFMEVKRDPEDLTRFELLDTVTVPVQQASGTTVTSASEAMASITDGVIRRCWWHSHVYMACNPSQQDLTEIQELLGMTSKFKLDSFFIMFITNKNGQHNAWIYTHQYAAKMDVEVVRAPNEYLSWAEETVKAQLSQKVYTPPNTNYAQYGAGFRQGGQKYIADEKIIVPAKPQGHVDYNGKPIAEMTDKEWEEFSMGRWD